MELWNCFHGRTIMELLSWSYNRTINHAVLLALSVVISVIRRDQRYLS
jgi:hypothetical protein